MAEEWAVSHPSELSIDEAEFLRCSREAQKQREATELEAARKLAEALRERAEEAEKREQEERVSSELRERLAREGRDRQEREIEVARKLAGEQKQRAELSEYREKEQKEAARKRWRRAIAALLIAVAFFSAGVWYLVANAMLTVHLHDPRMREHLATEIREQAQKRIASLNQTEDWRKINEIEKARDQQIADLDRVLDGIEEQFSKEGEASESYLTASKLLQENGSGEALAFLEAKSSQRAELIEAQMSRRDPEEKELRKLLQEELLAASLLEKQLRFKEAADRYRKVVGIFWVMRFKDSGRAAAD